VNLTLSFVKDPEFTKKEMTAEEKRLTELQTQLTSEELAHIRHQNQQLLMKQQQSQGLTPTNTNTNTNTLNIRYNRERT
jgi:Zn-dependent M16 (insulinase) family peptidase